MEIESGTVSRRAALGLFGAAAGAAAWSASGTAFAAPPAGAPVELVDAGDTVTLSNALVSATFDKATARTTSIRLVGSTQGNQDFNLVSGVNGGGYAEFNYTMGTTPFVRAITGATYRVVTQSADRVEIAMTVNDSANLPFVVELHAAIERDSPGIYYWMVYRYPEGMPDGLIIAQLRYAIAAGDPSFTYFVIDDLRGIQQRPTIADTQNWLKLQDTTYILPDGSMYAKYQNITDLEGDSNAFLISNGKVSMSVIQANKDWFVGGPTKQELTAHDFYGGEILLWHPYAQHFGSPPLAPPKGWEKIFGPFFLYVDEATGAADPAANVASMWERAKARAAREVAQWPYTWITDPLYAATTRSTVSGRLTLAGRGSTANAWVILSEPGTDWQFTNLDYVYSARADARGVFTIKGVRPGTYTLTAFVDGVLGEYKRHEVVVGASERLRLGQLVWRPVNHGRTVWQIGTPDRSSAEFHIFGGPQGFRKYLAYLEYPYEFPNGVDFTVGRDDIKTDWNYFQPMYATPGTDAQLAWRGTTPDRSLTTWKIRFDSDGYRRGTGTLDIALAGSVFGTLKVALNGTQLASFDPLPGPPGDASVYRQSYRAIYRQLPPIEFPADLITAGENVVTLSPVRPPKAPLTTAGRVDDWMEPMAGIMYDVLRLQVDEHRERRRSA
ncbi:MAG TPA: polysaccharide lyase family protein [Micromonosporaceae bacterium]|nr:polysaccharide lyase family protein [Micromonosporaceae bacterium]